MSSSSLEPENAAPTDTVRTEQGQQSSRDRDHNKIRRWPHSSRSNSASLLTQALAAQNEVDEKDLGKGGAFDPPEAFIISSQQPGPLRDNEPNNGVSTAYIAEVGTDQMAAVVPASTGNLGGAVTPGITQSIFNLPTMARADAGFTHQQALLNGSRPRGMSLERTEKERKVEDSPKGTYSTNPGDTALSPSTTPHITLDANNPPTEGVRARYRSWRDVRPDMASEKAWSIGEQGSGISRGQVERSITEAMTGAEHNNRSRKASHTLGLFKEGLPDGKPTRRESKSRGRSQNGSSGDNQRTGQEAPILGPVDYQKSHVLQDRERPAQSPLERSTSKSDSRRASHGNNSTTGLAAQQGYFNVSHRIETISEDQRKYLPPQLLDEIRKHHNLTPGAAKGSSFSRSIPVTASERPQHDSKEDSQSSKAAVVDVEDGADLTCVKSNDEDEESGEEQISSALFVPHHTRLESSEGNDHGLEKVVRPRPADARRDTDSLQWLEEHKVPTREVDKKYISQEAQPRPLVVPSPNHTKEQKPDSGTELLLPVSELPKAALATTDDGGITTAEEELSVAGALDTTPAGSLKPVNQIPPDYSQHFHDHEIDAKQPLEAIELIPYRHQVGGHTTLWKFSKRAVAKQLSNRENEFYETVERYHPQLMKFLPRYIGVLNVTFEKQNRRKSGRKDDADGATGRQDIAQDRTKDESKDGSAAPSTANGNASTITQEDQPRMVSQSLTSFSVPIPTVTFADNRHIIPKSFMQSHPCFIDAERRLHSDGVATMTTQAKSTYANGDSGDAKDRPTLSDKHAASWGATTVNKQLRNEVFEQAFLQGPIPIHRHKKPASQHRSLPPRPGGSNLRTSNSESSLQAAQQSQSGLNLPAPEESIRRRAMKAAAERRNGLAPLTSIEPKPSEAITKGDEEQAELEKKTGTSAPEPEIAYSPQRKPQRRYSSGGLRRKPAEVADDRGNLKYFEEADDAGYKGDVEEDVDVFPMDLDSSQNPVSPPALSALNPGPSAEAVQDEPVFPTADDSSTGISRAVLPLATREVPNNLLGIPRPVNPKEAQTQQNSRMVYFLVLEDLTAGMKRPCIMDLKMGTRQYGVDANEKKQKSQRRKCEATTSKELGVRVCGLQVWSAKTQEYIFLDKYVGRKLKAGREFQDALTRFLYDGVDYSAVLRHIPTIIAKLAKLEGIIEGLVGYRFYAASLLLFYEGDPQEVDESDSTATEKGMKQKNEIDFKIADFANSVTKEDFRSSDRPCPPRHPDQPDRGFLRGLRSLKKYFLAIQKEIRAKEMGERRGEESRNGNDSAVSGDSDPESGISC